MGFLLRLVPLCIVGIGLWRVFPAMKVGAQGLGAAQTITSINAVNLANALQGELGEAAGAPNELLHARKPDAKVVKGQKARVRLDGWDRPFQVRRTRDQIEVISCGEDGECGTYDDLIEVVRADGKRSRILSGEQDRAPKPLPRP